MDILTIRRCKPTQRRDFAGMGCCIVWKAQETVLRWRFFLSNNVATKRKSCFIIGEQNKRGTLNMLVTALYLLHSFNATK